MKLRVKKLPILLPLFLVAGILIAAAVTIRLDRDNASAHTDLGQKYLNDMDYTGAIAEFLRVLSLDPTSRDARLGLAEAYVGAGNPEMVPEILEPLTEARVPEAYRLLIDSQTDVDIRQALITAQELVEHTDQEEDYAVRDEILELALAEKHSYAAGLDQELLLSGGKVLSRGSNILGQLGTDQNLAEESVQSSFQSAEFPGEAVRVYCAGRTSYVVDGDGNLWAAGENRWGQMGLDYASADPQSGWQLIVDDGNVASAAGSVGILYVLKMDGSLWYAGQGGNMELSRVNGIGRAVSLEAGERQTAVLTADGTLYSSYAEDPDAWIRIAGQVKQFSLGSGGLIWVTQDNTIRSEYGIPAVPDAWLQNGQEAAPDFTVSDIAADAGGLLLLDTSGQLHRVSGGQVYEEEMPETANIYSAGGSVVVEQEDGTVSFWDLSQPAPEPAA